MPSTRQHKILLDESELPTRWYNVLHDLPTPPPPALHPGTGQPVGPDDLAPLFPAALIEQELARSQASPRTCRWSGTRIRAARSPSRARWS